CAFCALGADGRLALLLGLGVRFFSGSASSDDPARRSRSSIRRLSFLPASIVSASVFRLLLIGTRHTVISLGNAVLYPPALSEVGDLGPVLVGVGRAAEGAAGAVCGVVSCRCRRRTVDVVLGHGEHGHCEGC